MPKFIEQLLEMHELNPFAEFETEIPDFLSGSEEEIPEFWHKTEAEIERDGHVW